MSPTRFGYALANGTVGIYNQTARYWRIKVSMIKLETSEQLEYPASRNVYLTLLEICSQKDPDGSHYHGIEVPSYLFMCIEGFHHVFVVAIFFFSTATTWMFFSSSSSLSFSLSTSSSSSSSSIQFGRCPVLIG